SRLLLLQVFILKNYLTQCHFHTWTERGASGKNDFNLKPGSKDSVTGVPYPPSKDVKATPDLRDRMGRKQPRTVITIGTNQHPPLKHINNTSGLSLDDLYSFYRKEGKRYVLHCGCDLEEVLLDFLVWKTSPPLRSRSKGIEEDLGSPLHPREQLYQYDMLQSLHFRLDDHLFYDLEGSFRSLSQTKNLYKALQ
ncbi:hypothetical protein BKA70DRAFT_1033651, partial [Coprinopsis sp. MPI-PUGE-AT-0042]